MEKNKVDKASKKWRKGKVKEQKVGSEWIRGRGLPRAHTGHWMQ